MKVVTGETMQRIDRRTIEEFGINGITLMENAGRGCAELMLNVLCPWGKRAIVVAGKGNNGGDGYVIARVLQERGWKVMTLVLARREQISGDARINLDRLDNDTVVFCPEQGTIGRIFPGLGPADVIVDALLGTGLQNAVGGLYAEAILVINGAGKPVVAVDIPSGIDSTTGRALGCAVQADMTVTFALAKVGHVLLPGAVHTGELHVIDIGIPSEVIADAEGYEFLDVQAVKSLFRRRERGAHKGNFGHSMIVAGSIGKTGAAALAANSAVRAGAGLVTLAIPASLNAILEIKTTESMTLPLPDAGTGYLAQEAATAITEGLAGKNALALGPGLSWHTETAWVVRDLVEKTNLPLVVDADGLNAISEDTSLLLRRCAAELILTPHPGEMARLWCNLTAADVEADRIGTARDFASRHGVHVILKGARTVVASPDGRIAINGSGNPGMASGGMGDVLTGVLVALLSQGYDAFSACKIGVFVHGYAADLVAEDKGEIGMCATDVQERLPYAIRQLTTESDVIHKEAPC